MRTGLISRNIGRSFPWIEGGGNRVGGFPPQADSAVQRLAWTTCNRLREHRLAEGGAEPLLFRGTFVMKILRQIALLGIYGLILAARLLAFLLGMDPLRRCKPRNQSTYWIERNQELPVESYFSEGQPARGSAGPDGSVESRGVAGLIMSLVRLLALFGLWRRRRTSGKKGRQTRFDGEIPDEVYTLW